MVACRISLERISGQNVQKRLAANALGYGHYRLKVSDYGQAEG
jgi:hypothetical protein